MFDITFKLNGRKVRPNQIGDALEKALLQKVEDDIKKKVATVRCPEHGQAAQIVASGRSIDKLRFDIKGCCEKLISDVKKKLG